MVGSKNVVFWMCGLVEARAQGLKAFIPSWRLVGFDPADLAAQVAHAIRSGGALLSSLKFIQNLLPALV